MVSGLCVVSEQHRRRERDIDYVRTGETRAHTRLSTRNYAAVCRLQPAPALESCGRHAARMLTSLAD